MNQVYTEQKEIVINGQTIKAGEHKTVSLNTYHLPTKTAIEVPVVVMRSLNPGPTVFFQAGMHGEEINGIEVLRKIMLRDDIRQLNCGSIIFIPIINVVSFLYQSRDLPDGRDLNRCFPGNKNGSLGARIAYDLAKHIIPNIDFGVDFHTGGAKINNFPQVRCVFGFGDNLPLAEIFSPPLIIDSKYREGTLRKEAAKYQKTILVYEGGESMRFDYRAINEGINGCLRLLKHFQMIETEIPDNPSVKVSKDTWVRAKISGLMHINISNGAFVNKGDLIGVICNPYGEVEEKLVSPVDGYIIGINNQPVVNQGDAIIHVGY
jgi:uncharacterized protein